MRGIILLVFACCFMSLPFTAYGQDDLTHFEKANELFKKNKWEEAKKHIDIGIEESPLDADLLMLNGKYYHMKGNNSLARQNLMKSIQLDPKNVDAKQILVNVEMESENYSAAICYVNELLEINPYWKGLWRKKIDLYRLQDNDVEANRLLKRMNQIYPEDSQLQDEYRTSLQGDINELKKSGKLLEALEKSDELLKLEGNSETAYLEIINTFLTAGDKEKALSYSNRALTSYPNSTTFIKKKASILADIGRFTEALQFLKTKMSGNSQLASMYNGILLENARFQNQSDPYVLYGKIFERNPGNRESLTFLLNTSLSRGYNTDAIYYIAQAKKIQGETTEILYKEFMLYKSMGNESKSDQILLKLHKMSPNDSDIHDYYLAYQYKLAKQRVLNNENRDALVPLHYIVNEPNNDYSEYALQLLLNVYMNLGRNQDATKISDSLISSYPDNINNYFKKVSVLLADDKPAEAMDFYEGILNNMDDAERSSYEAGYEEIALHLTKELMDGGQPERAFEIIEKVLTMNPEKELAYQYGLSNAFRTDDKEKFLDYGRRAANIYPESIFFTAKYAEGLFLIDSIADADSVITPVFEKYPYNESVIGVKTDIALSQSTELFTEKLGDSLLELTNSVLAYNSKSTDLLLYKGLAFELLKDYDSAYYFQSFYVPSPMEEKEFMYHMKWLKYKTYLHQVSFFHLRSRFGDKSSITGLSTLEYTRFYDSKNTLTGRIHYTGRDQGAGFLMQGEWSRIINPKWRFIANAGYGTRYFSQIILNARVFKALKNEYEVSAGIGYRYLPNVYSLLNVSVGVSKKWENIRLNSNLNVYYSEGSFFYNLLLNSRYYLFAEGRTFVEATFSVGSISETGALDLSLYNSWNAFNTMAGLGFQHMVTSRLTVGVIGNWYNIKYAETDYRNLHNIYLRVSYSL